MEKVELDQNKKYYFEEFGVLIEKSGMPRMAGRILALLLISKEPSLSIGDMTEALDVSKGSISTMLRLLMQIGLVEKIVIPGKRRDHYCVNGKLWPKFIYDRLLVISEYKKLAEKGLSIIDEENAQAKNKLEQFYHVFSFFDKVFADYLKQYS